MSAPLVGAPVQATSRPGISKIARSGLLNLVGAGVSSVSGVLLVVVVAHVLPQADAGVFFALTSVFLLAEMVACIGTGTGLVYFIARMRSLGSPEQIRAFQRVAFLPVIVGSVIASVALIVGAPAVGELVGGGSDHARNAVVVLALLLPVATVSDSLLAATQGHATMVPTVVAERIGRPLLQFGLVAAVVGGGSVVLLTTAWALPWVASALLGGWFLLRLQRPLPRGSADARPTGATWSEFWRFTWPRAVTSVAQLLLQRLDVILITVLIGPAQAAVYTAATRFLVVGQLANTSIGNAAQPRLAELFAVDDRASAKAVYQSVTAWVVLLTWPMYLLCAVFSDAILAIFGSGYAGGRPVIYVLAAAMIFATACGMVNVLLNMAGRTTWTLANSLVAVGIMVGIDVLLIPGLGILGAAIGWATAIVAINALPLVQLFVSFRLHPFGRATLVAAALSAACFGVLPWSTRLLLPDDVWPAVAAVAVEGTAFLGACLRWRGTLGLPAVTGLRRRVFADRRRGPLLD